MADYTQPERVDRRLRYFDGQFLREQDFIDEQRYHLDRERRLARIAHSPGVIEGLTVEAVPNAPKVTVAAGTALDGHGRLLVRVDAGEPLDLTHLVNRDGPVAVIVALIYAVLEADAPQGGGSPRWREAPEVTAFREGDADAPAEEDARRLARVTLHPEGTVSVDQDWAAVRSGLAVGGALSVAGPASFTGGIDGGRTGDGEAAPVVVRADLQLTKESGRDGTVRLDVTNGATDFGRANVVLTGRLQDGNDGWAFGTGARNSVVFARNAAETGQAVGAAGEEQVSLQLEGNSRALGILTRDRAAEPAVTIAQDGAVQVGTGQQPASLGVAGDLTASGSLAVSETGRWSAQVYNQGQLVDITIAAGSWRNLVVVRLTNDRPISSFRVVVPEGTETRWIGRYMFFDPVNQVASQLTPLIQGLPLSGSSLASGLPSGARPQVLLLEVHHVTTLQA
jgi:hypothetical protein